MVDVFVFAQAFEDERAFANATATVKDDQGWTWAGVFGLEQFEAPDWHKKRKVGLSPENLSRTLFLVIQPSHLEFSHRIRITQRS